MHDQSILRQIKYLLLSKGKRKREIPFWLQKLGIWTRIIGVGVTLVLGLIAFFQGKKIKELDKVISRLDTSNSLLLLNASPTVQLNGQFDYKYSSTSSPMNSIQLINNGLVEATNINISVYYTYIDSQPGGCFRKDSKLERLLPKQPIWLRDTLNFLKPYSFRGQEFIPMKITFKFTNPIKSTREIKSEYFKYELFNHSIINIRVLSIEEINKIDFLANKNDSIIGSNSRDTIFRLPQK